MSSIVVWSIKSMARARASPRTPGPSTDFDDEEVLFENPVDP
jgi:hypothetical protein